MPLGMLGHKVGMTQIFDKSGDVIPVTVLQVGPCIVTQIKTVLTDGYNAVQVGYDNIAAQKLTKPELGHLKKSSSLPLKYLHEYKVPDVDNFDLGQSISMETFVDFSTITITGKSIGKGFAGNQKRHNFRSWPNDTWFKKSSCTWFNRCGNNTRTCYSWKKNGRTIRW